MAIGKEERRFPRVDITWPVVVVTTNGQLDGETQNLGLGGVFIRCSEAPELEENFRLVIKPPENQLLPATAEIVWSDIFISDQSMFYGMGVSFNYVFDDDRQYLSRAISAHI
jgi:hypothetical protein